ncbi:hypothetical protein HAX54_004927, partial [Datura stramonium]|nr:hypothetical protein [Datura stramonium]
SVSIGSAKGKNSSSIATPTSASATDKVGHCHAAKGAEIQKSRSEEEIEKSQRRNVSSSPIGANKQPYAMEGNGTITLAENTWVNLFQKNWHATNGMALNYIPPTILNRETIVQLDRMEVDKET